MNNVPKALVFYNNNTYNDVYAQLFTDALLGSVRSVMIDNKVYFAGLDVARCLGYAKPDKALSDHVSFSNKLFLNKSFLDQISTPPTTGGVEIPYSNYGMNFINIAGVFQLVSHSKLISAEVFQNWVTSEVLPTMYNIGFTKSMSILREENSILNSRLDNIDTDKQYYKRQYDCERYRYNELDNKYNELDNKYNELDSRYKELDSNYKDICEDYDRVVDQFQYVMDNNDIKYY